MIDTMNKFLVAMRGENILIMRPPMNPTGITPDEALVLAATIVAMAEPFAKHEFSEVLEAVQNA